MSTDILIQHEGYSELPDHESEGICGVLDVDDEWFDRATDAFEGRPGAQEEADLLFRQLQDIGQRSLSQRVNLKHTRL